MGPLNRTLQADRIEKRKKCESPPFPKTKRRSPGSHPPGVSAHPPIPPLYPPQDIVCATSLSFLSGFCRHFPAAAPTLASRLYCCPQKLIIFSHAHEPQKKKSPPLVRLAWTRPHNIHFSPRPPPPFFEHPTPRAFAHIFNTPPTPFDQHKKKRSHLWSPVGTDILEDPPVSPASEPPGHLKVQLSVFLSALNPDPFRWRVSRCFFQVFSHMKKKTPGGTGKPPPGLRGPRLLGTRKSRPIQASRAKPPLNWNRARPTRPSLWGVVPWPEMCLI